LSPPIIIDRRKNPSKKNLTNRQRFLERFRDRVKDAARKQIADRKITNDGDQEITISGSGIDEPRFGHRPDTGDWDYVLPGNDEYIPGDTIDKPKGQSSGGRGRTGSRDGEGEDDFSFLISYDEYLDLIFDDLELPDLLKKSEAYISNQQFRRAGYTTAGVPSNLNVEKTAIAGMSRRLALKSPKFSKIRELEEQLENETDELKRQWLVDEIKRLKKVAQAIAWLDKVDLRYNNFVPKPVPITQAVMFCIMDVSYSMGEKEKIIAKKFFLLLHLFLKRRYKELDVVFIRHHSEAEECDEDTFFTSSKSGGTVVSTALELTHKIIKQRYPADRWNIYIAQASDGDNEIDDGNVVHTWLDQLMKITQFMAYIEISRDQSSFMFNPSLTTLWQVISQAKESHKQISMQSIHQESEVISIFRKIFSRTN
jgi:uncharacterized protein